MTINPLVNNTFTSYIKHEISLVLPLFLHERKRIPTG